MPVTLKSRIPDMMRDVVEFAGLRSEVGFFGQGRYPDGSRVVDIAFFNEFGTKDIPARSFVRGAFFAHQNEIGALIAKEAQQVTLGIKRPADAHRIIGAFAASKVAHRINTSSQWAKPNAPSTIAQKGLGKPPLHDTERLARSISYVVRDKGGRFVARGKPAE